MDTLSDARKNKGLSQEGLADKCDLSQWTITQIETGKIAPRPESRKRIENVLGQKIDWLTTKGLRSFRQGEMTSWELVEQNYRRALLEINCLSLDERSEFIKVARHYLKVFETQFIKGGKK